MLADAPTMDGAGRESTTSSGRILVVDDNEANRSLAAETLADEGHEVVLASGGREAIAAFEKSPPDCVLLDVRMPDLDGFAVCERIRSLPGGPETPIIFFTALRDVDTFDRALRVGGDDFLTKPVRPTELVVRVQAALKLRRMSATLREHYELLRRQRDDLMRLQLLKERLMAFVVHDLKNPVNTIDLHAQLLLRDRHLEGQGRESASAIRAETRLLNRMILNLLDVAKADEAALLPKKSKVDLRPLVAAIADELVPMAEARSVRIETRLGAEQAFADEDLLRRTIINLAENAIRHAPPETVVSIETLDRGDAVEVRVADHGRGISPEMQRRIFEPFVQGLAEGEERSRGGRGLGLAFCKCAVVAHGGELWCEDANPGATFCARFPNDVS